MIRRTFIKALSTAVLGLSLGIARPLELESAKVVEDYEYIKDFYTGHLLVIVDGTGKDQVRVIASSEGRNLVPEVDWDTAPDSTSVYEIINPCEMYSQEPNHA